MSTAALWQVYKTEQDEAVKEKLIHEYLPLVKRAVSRIRPSLPPTVSEEDLVGYGLVGLLQAIDRYDVSKGVLFETYGLRRINGAILDGLRVMGWLPRTLHQKARKLKEAVVELEARLGRVAKECEIADYLGISTEEYDMLLKQIAPVVMVSLEEAVQQAERKAEENVWKEWERKQVLDAIADAIRDLPEREQVVLSLYFYEQMTLKEIATVLKVTEGRASQLKTQALIRVQVVLKANGWE